MDDGLTGKNASGRSSPQKIRETETFLRLQSEIDLIQSVSASRGVDWFLVRKLASEILETQGKDLLVVCYLSVALARTSGIPGLMEGISILSDLVRNSWSTMFPPANKLRSRRNALSWWIEKTLEAIASREWETTPSTVSERIRTELGALGEDLSLRDPDAPSLSPLLSLVSRKTVAQEAPERNAHAEQTGPDPGSAVLSPATGPDEPSDPDALFESGFQLLKKASDLVFEKDLRDPRCFRYSRMAFWDPVMTLPVADGAVTRIPPPPPQFRDSLELIAEKGAPEDLVRFAESHHETYPLWFDLSFYSARGLGLMGKDAKDALTALVSEVRTFLGRCSGIERMLFSDGAPLSSPDCLTWIREVIRTEGFPESGNGGENPFMKEIRTILSGGNIPASIARFDAIRKKSRDSRERFLLDLEFLSYAELDDSGNVPLESMALAIFEDLKNYRIEVWEPSLALRALRAIFRVLKRRDGMSGISREILKRMAALDLTEASEAFQESL